MTFPSMQDWQDMDAEVDAGAVPTQPRDEVADRVEELQELISI
jgi:hypothetical protein